MTDSNASAFASALGVLESGFNALPDKPEETLEATLAALWHFAAGSRYSVVAAVGTALPSLDSDGTARLAELIDQRLSGVPLAHITGRQSFMGLEMISAPGALIPRRETEILGAALVEKGSEMAESGSPFLVVDVCTGSGNLALMMASRFPQARVFASDLSEEAVRLAERNAEHLGLQRSVEMRVGDLFAPFDTAQFLGQVDLLSCNPPYISTSRMTGMPHEIAGHEPALAFDGGALGVRVIQRLISEAPRFLRQGGWLVFEVGLGQASAVMNRIAKTGKFDSVSAYKDGAGEGRVVAARLM